MKRKDLAGALGFLKSIENNPIESVNGSASAESARSRLAELGLAGYERDWEVLDTCLNADDLKLVGSAYVFLKDRGFLPNFGKCRNIGKSFIYVCVCVVCLIFANLLKFVEHLVQLEGFFFPPILINLLVST